jgi:hypothetical protein
MCRPRFGGGRASLQRADRAVDRARQSFADKTAQGRICFRQRKRVGAQAAQIVPVGGKHGERMFDGLIAVPAHAFDGQILRDNAVGIEVRHRVLEMTAKNDAAMAAREMKRGEERGLDASAIENQIHHLAAGEIGHGLKQIVIAQFDRMVGAKQFRHLQPGTIVGGGRAADGETAVGLPTLQLP